MWDQEKKHLEKFNTILGEQRVRPTLLLPLWNISGFLLGTLLLRHACSCTWVLFLNVLFWSAAAGACSALLGKEGAMACTVAVEESISEHYNSQIRALMEVDPERYTELLQVWWFVQIILTQLVLSKANNRHLTERSCISNFFRSLKSFVMMKWSIMTQDWSMTLNLWVFASLINVKYELHTVVYLA